MKIPPIFGSAPLFPFEERGEEVRLSPIEFLPSEPAFPLSALREAAPREEETLQLFSLLLGLQRALREEKGREEPPSSWRRV